MAAHTSVLLTACIESLSIKPGGVYVDGTFGRGGHSREILAELGMGGQLIGIDKDPEAIDHAKVNFSQQNFSILHGSFADIVDITKQEGVYGKVDGILLDLGVSSPQLDKAERGFSFMRNGPLDMRMNSAAGMTASEWVMTAELEEMVTVFKKYGEEKFARRVATAITDYRQNGVIDTTQQLVDIITDAKPVKEKNKHPATRVFQAIRIHINKELEDLEVFLDSCLDTLKVGGRLVVISFHSLEDRLVKHFMRQASRGKQIPIEVPVQADELAQGVKLKKIGKAIKPTIEETYTNIRARSAVLRVGEKLR